MASDYVSQVGIPEMIAKAFVEPTGMKASVTRRGWAYLGQFSEEEGVWKWKKKYFSDIGETQEPLTLKKEKYLTVSKVTGNLNVRENMPDRNAKFFKVVDVISPGTKVTVLDVRQWDSTGYWWAEIMY
jgi:hypothetical protein